MPRRVTGGRTGSRRGPATPPRTPRAARPHGPVSPQSHGPRGLGADLCRAFVGRPSGADVDIEVHAVLGHLGFGHPLERPRPRRRGPRWRRRSAAGPPALPAPPAPRPPAEPLRRRLFDVTQQLGPERPQPRRVTRVEAHLQSHRHDGPPSRSRSWWQPHPHGPARPAPPTARPGNQTPVVAGTRGWCRGCLVSWSPRSSGAAPSSGRRARRAAGRPARSAGRTPPGASGR